MFLKDMSDSYRQTAAEATLRIHLLTAELGATRSPNRRRLLKSQIRMLYEIRCEAAELCELTENYYYRGYRIDGKYTV